MQRRQSQRPRDVLDAGPRPLEDVYETGEVERVTIESARRGPRSTRRGTNLGDEWDNGVERVGGRRRLRGEIVLLVAGLAFLAGALLKPWPSPAPALHQSPNPSSSSAAIAAVQSPSTTASPSAVAYPDIAPGNFRGQFPVPAATAGLAGAQTGEGQTYSWTTVDWSALNAEDEHAGWGFAAAVMAGGPAGLASPSALSPTTTWVTLGSPPVYSAVPLVQTRGVFAIALTWPSNVRVSRVSFLYLGGPQHPAYLPPTRFLPNTLLTPLPAASVASTSSVTGIAGQSIRSGEFLIPPITAASSAARHSLAAAWRSSPWPWPYGAYQVTVTSATGTTRVVLELLLTG